MMLALENRQHRTQGRAMVERMIRAGGDANHQLPHGDLMKGKVCCFEDFDADDLTTQDSCCVTLIKQSGVSTKICMPAEDLISSIDLSASYLPSDAMDFRHFLHELDGVTFMCQNMIGLYDFSISVKYPASLGYGRDTYIVVFRFPGDELPDGSTTTVVRDPRTTLGHHIIETVGYGAREFHSLVPLLDKYCSPLLKRADGNTSVDVFTMRMTERGQSGARPSRVMNKRLRDMQNDVADMNAYIHAPTPKKGKPSSFLDCLPSDIMHGVMQIMSGGSL
jgi:hypothetical protein